MKLLMKPVSLEKTIVVINERKRFVLYGTTDASFYLVFYVPLEERVGQRVDGRV